MTTNNVLQRGSDSPFHSSAGVRVLTAAAEHMLRLLDEAKQDDEVAHRAPRCLVPVAGPRKGGLSIDVALAYKEVAYASTGARQVTKRPQ